MSHRPVCVECGVEFRVKKNGAALVDLSKDKTPRKLWETDVWECPMCLASVALISAGQQPLATVRDDDFDLVLAQMKKAVGKWYIESNED